MSAVNRKKSSEGDKKQSRRQIEKLLDNFLKVKLEKRRNHIPSARFSVTTSVGTHSSEPKLAATSLPSIYPANAGSANLPEVNNYNNNTNATTNNANSRDRSDSGSKRRGKLTLNWKKVKKPIANILNRSDSRPDQRKSSNNGKGKLGKQN